MFSKKIYFCLLLLLFGDSVMSPQGIVAKIIINPIKTIVKHLNKKTLIAGLLSLSGMLLIHAQLSLLSYIKNINAYAQSEQIIDPMSEALNEAQTKVAIATSPGAFGHGVPSIYNIPLQEFLLALGIAGAICISIYFVAEWLLKHIKKKVTAYQ